MLTHQAKRDLICSDFFDVRKNFIIVLCFKYSDLLHQREMRVGDGLDLFRLAYYSLCFAEWA